MLHIMIDRETIEAVRDMIKGDQPEQYRLGYLTGTVDVNSALVEGVEIPKQESSVVMTEVRTEEAYRIRQSVEERNQDLLGIVFYHGSMPAFENETERQARERFGVREVPNLALVVNANGSAAIFAEPGLVVDAPEDVPVRYVA